MVNNNAGSLDTQLTTSNVARFTKTVTGLQPGVTYNILVRAKKNGKYSNYTTYTYCSPETDKSGNNFTVSNQNTDIQLLGGGFAASLSTDPLPINIGKINVTDTITSGTGVIMNQYGLAGYKAGTKTFYINAGTGDAYFGGTVTSTATISGSAIFGSTTVTEAISSISTAQSTASSAYSLADSKLAAGGGVVANPTTKQITSINANSGISVYSGTIGGARIILNSEGLAAYALDGTTPTFVLQSSDGSAAFKGSITAGSTITGAILKTGSETNNIQISQQSDGTYGSFGKIIFTTGSAYDGGIYASSGVTLPGINSPHILIESPRENSSYASRITLVGDNDGYIKFEAGNTYVALDSVAGLMQLFQTSDNLSSVLNKTGFRNVYVSSTAGNPSPSNPQNGDIKLEW